MNPINHFIYDTSIEVSASQIGIGKWNWKFIDEENKEKARKIMAEKRFDVLPIKNQDNKFTHYYATAEWNNYDNINKLKIKDAQTVYYRLSLKDLIRKFKNEERHYYFLVDSEEVLGLVSFVNLNCLQVYNYLFSVISDIEKSILDLFRKYLNQQRVIESFKNSNDESQKEIVRQYEVMVSKNIDIDFYSLQYLPTLGIILKKFLNELPNEKRQLGAFTKKFDRNTGIYTKLRNKIMHPVRPILSDNLSIIQIDELLSDYDKIKSILSDE